jgi:micrococcal nuclease
MYTYKVKEVVRIVDGDTIDLIIDAGFYIYVQQRIRLKGIDAPETRTLDLKEKDEGLRAKEWLERELKDRQVTIKTTKEDKYGRMLGELFTRDHYLSINERMLQEGFAAKYM